MVEHPIFPLDPKFHTVHPSLCLRLSMIMGSVPPDVVRQIKKSPLAGSYSHEVSKSQFSASISVKLTGAGSYTAWRFRSLFPDKETARTVGQLIIENIRGL